MVAFFRVQGFNFGLASAPVTFNRLSFFVCRAAARLIPVVASNYFDNFCVTEPGFSGPSGKHFLRKFGDLIGAGFSNDEAKNRPWAVTNTFLGIVSDFSSFSDTRSIVCSVSEDKLRSTLEMLTQIERQGSFERYQRRREAHWKAPICFIVGWRSLWSCGSSAADRL